MFVVANAVQWNIVEYACERSCAFEVVVALLIGPVFGPLAVSRRHHCSLELLEFVGIVVKCSVVVRRTHGLFTELDWCIGPYAGREIDRIVPLCDYRGHC